MSGKFRDAHLAAVVVPAEPQAVLLENFRRSLTCEGGDLRLLIALVAAGHGLALLPAGLARHPGLVEVPVRAPRIVHRTDLLHPRTTDPPAKAFIAALTGVHRRREANAHR